MNPESIHDKTNEGSLKIKRISVSPQCRALRHKMQNRSSEFPQRDRFRITMPLKEKKTMTVIPKDTKMTTDERNKIIEDISDKAGGISTFKTTGSSYSFYQQKWPIIVCTNTKMLSSDKIKIIADNLEESIINTNTKLTIKEHEMFTVMQCLRELDQTVLDMAVDIKSKNGNNLNKYLDVLQIQDLQGNCQVKEIATAVCIFVREICIIVTDCQSDLFLDQISTLVVKVVSMVVSYKWKEDVLIDSLSKQRTIDQVIKAVQSKSALKIYNKQMSQKSFQPEIQQISQITWTMRREITPTKTSDVWNGEKVKGWINKKHVDQSVLCKQQPPHNIHKPQRRKQKYNVYRSGILLLTLVAILRNSFVSCKLLFPDVNICGQMKTVGSVFIIKANCTTVQQPFGCSAEIFVNGTTVDEIRYNQGNCFHQKGLCDSESCKCSPDCKEFTWNFKYHSRPTNTTFSCRMSFKNGADIERSMIYNGTDFTIIKTPVVYPTDRNTATEPTTTETDESQSVNVYIPIYVITGICALVLIVSVPLFIRRDLQNIKKGSEQVATHNQGEASSCDQLLPGN